MKHIDEAKLETDLTYRFGYVSEFMEFTKADIDAIHAAAPILGPLVPALVDAVYNKLYDYDCTWRHFLPRQAGYGGAVPTALENLTMDHPQIAFRKQHLARYLEKLVTAPYDVTMLRYLDNVGRMHTARVGSNEIEVPLVQMNALMGFVAAALAGVLFEAPIAPAEKGAALAAFTKLLWLQNDLIARHYAAQPGECAHRCGATC